MADPKSVATSEKKDKYSILDDDIGKDILSSWKSISVTEDTGDFKLEPMGKSKKNDFSFDKMDMDFNLGGEFGKLSSFKMDMSDLDFSFPSKKNKATETTERDYGGVNTRGKEDRFNFSFDFDNFDIDAALSKADTFSSKQKDIQKHVNDKTDTEVSEVQDNEVTVADILKNPKKCQTSETVEAMHVQVLADHHDTSMTGSHSLRCDTSVDIVLQSGAETASDKAVHDARESAIDCSYLPVDRLISHEYNDQSMPSSNLGLGSLIEPPEECCPSGKIVYANVGGEQSICYEAAADAVQPKSPESVLPQIAECLEDNTNRNKILSDSNGICIEELVIPRSDIGGSSKIVQCKTLKLSQEYNDVNGIASNTSADVKESSDVVCASHDASVASSVKIQHRVMKTQLSPLSSREPMVGKSPLGKEKGTKLVPLKFIGKSDEGNKPDHESSVFTKPKSSNVINTHSDCPLEKRETIAREMPIGIHAEGGFVSHKKVAEGEHTLLRNQRTLITAKENSLHISHSKSVEMSNEIESQKSEKANVTLTSIMDCTQSMRHISSAKDKSLPFKTVTRNRDLTDLKSSRWISEKKLQSISGTTNEIKSLKDLKQKGVKDVTPKVAVLNLTENQKPETPTLKRKQAPTGGLVHEIPLKRLSQSPKDNSIHNFSEMKIQCQVQCESNTMDRNASSHSVYVPKVSMFDTPGQMNSSALDIACEIGDFRMVEKAAAYGKDLDDLCNMLKKKKEEAKELLVRAVVNNNNLLLLNHPMHEEKIRSVQKLANRLMAMEIVPYPR